MAKNTPKKQTAKKQPAKKAAAKKSVAKKETAKKAPAKKKPAKKAATPVKRQTPKVSVVSRPATSTTGTTAEVSITVTTPENVAGLAEQVTSVIRANDIKSSSLRKRMLGWFTRK